MKDDSSHDEHDIGPSRSARKREAQAVRALAEQLVAMTPAQLGRVALPEEVRAEVGRVRGIKAHVARKRQLGHLAKLMRRLEDEELVPARAEVEGDRDLRLREAATLQRAEALRETLLEGGDAALGALLDRYPQLDRQHLRSLLRRARSEREQGKPPRAARELFRLLRDLPED